MTVPIRARAPYLVTFALFAPGTLMALACGSGGHASSSSDASAMDDAPGASTGGGNGSSGSGSSGSGSSGGVTTDANGGDAWSAPDVGPPLEAGSPGQVDITFEIQANQSLHAISPYIYGVNDGTMAAAIHATIVRSGGNRLTAYNWENNASNAGSDYMFENDDYLTSSTTPGAYLASVIAQAQAAHAAALMTVPIVDYVSADESPGGDVRSSGTNYLMTRFKQNKAAKGSAFVYPPNTTDAYVYEDEMVHWLTTSSAGMTIRFQLDNEPDLWSSTHAEVHPTAVTYAELAMRNVTYAKAIKAAAPPGTEVFGPVNYGWEGYVTLQNASDSAADGDFIDWWLGQMAAAEKTAGTRLIDGLDLHWYPEATGNGMRIVGGDSSAPVAAAREQAPRSLWDSTYTETSWITSSINGPIDLIPLMLGKIAAHYPGTKLSFSEWNYGGGADISGGIAAADVLGIFGRDGVDMATEWPEGTETFTYASFKAYRDYDGNGATFGDTSVSATTTDVPDSSVYASLMSTDASHLVIVAINKATTTKVAGLVIEHPTSFKTASVYTLTSSGPTLTAGTALTATATNAFRYSMPAQSVTVIVPSP